MPTTLVHHLVCRRLGCSLVCDISNFSTMRAKRGGKVCLEWLSQTDVLPVLNYFCAWRSNWTDLNATNFRWIPIDHKSILKVKQVPSPADVKNTLDIRPPFMATIKKHHNFKHSQIPSTLILRICFILSLIFNLKLCILFKNK